jgi:hypothetical protein
MQSAFPTLSLEVNSEGVLVASTRLQQLTAAGARAETSAQTLKASTDALSESHRRQAAALLTVEQAMEREMARARSATSSNDRLAESLQRMRVAGQQSQANAMASMIQASDPFQKTAESLDHVTESAGHSHLAIGRINMGLEALAVDALGANSQLGAIATRFFEFGTGGVATLAALGGLAVIGLAWEHISEVSKKAEEDQKAAVSAIQGLRSRQENFVLGDVPHQREQLIQRQGDLQADLALAQKMNSMLGGTTNVLGMLGRLIYGDPEKMKRDLGEITRLIQVAAAEEKRLESQANEPTRLAGLEARRNELEIALQEQKLHSKFVQGGSEGGPAKSDFALDLQANAARLEATKQQIDAEFRVVDASGQVVALSKEQQAAKSKLIDQAKELFALAQKLLGAEDQINLQANKAQQLSGSDSIDDRLKGRLEMVEIEKRAEIQKTGDVETAEMRAEQRIHQARMQHTQELLDKIRGYFDTFASPLLSLSGGSGGQFASSVLGGFMQGFSVSGGNPFGAAAGGAVALVSSIVNIGRASREAREQLDHAREALKANLSGQDAALAQFISANQQIHDLYDKQIEQNRQQLGAIQESNRLEAERNALLDENAQRYEKAIDAQKRLAVLDEQDLKTRALRAAGLSEEADALDLATKQQREYETAVSSGKDATYLAALVEVQKAEAEKAAADQAIVHRRALEDLNVRRAIAVGLDQETADALQFQIQQQREYEDAVTAGKDALYLATLAETQRAETVARSVAQIQSKIAGLDSTIGGLQAFRNQLLLSDAAGLSPTDRLAEAQRQYQSIATAAKGGDASATGNLPGAANTFLEALRAVNASGPEFQAGLSQVLADTAAVMKVFEDQRSIAQQQLDALLAIQATIKANAEAYAFDGTTGRPRFPGFDDSVNIAAKTADNTAATIQVLQIGFAQLSSKLDAVVGKIDENSSITRNAFEGATL